MAIYESELTKDMLCPKASQAVTQAPHRKYGPEIDPFMNLLLQLFMQGIIKCLQREAPIPGSALWGTGTVKSESQPMGSSRHHSEWVWDKTAVCCHRKLSFALLRRLEGMGSFGGSSKELVSQVLTSSGTT